MLSDLRYAFRQLTKSPGFTAVALLTLALGIGLNTSLFSTLNLIIFRPLPYSDPGQLVRVYRTSQQSQTWQHSAANFLDLQGQNQVFERMAACSFASFNLAEPGTPAELLQGMNVTSDFFPTLGVQPELGRWFTTDEDQPGHNQTVIITHELWTGRFAADPQIIGRVLRINGESLTVTGVMPAGFVFPFLFGDINIWRPIAFTNDQRQNRTNNRLNVIARLKPGVSITRADTEMRGLAARLGRAYPQENGPDSLRVIDLKQSCMDSFGHRLSWFTMGLGLVVLLIASANLANLQLARAGTRTREYAVRSALGASRWFLMRPLLIESFLIALFGGLLGLLVAMWGNHFIGSRIQVGNQTGVVLPLDLRVLGFAFFASLFAGLICGITPALNASRLNVNENLKHGGKSATSSRAHHRFKQALVISQIALALTLLAGAGYFIRGFHAYLQSDPGWNTAGVWTGSVHLSGQQYRTPAQLRTIHLQLEEGLTAIPGVDHAALSSTLPIYGYYSSDKFIVEGQPEAPVGQEPLIAQARVSPDFFATLGIPFRDGQTFSQNLSRTDPAVVIINETTARSFWPGKSAVGQRIKGFGDKTWVQIVGVVGDVRFPGNPSEPSTRLQLYRPQAQAPGASLCLTLRSSLEPTALTDTVRRVVAALDPDLPVHQPGPVRQIINKAGANFDLVSQLLGASAALGLLLSTIGIYGVVAALTVQRTQEIGIRLALGATTTDVLWLILRSGIRMTLIGSVIGLLGAAAIGQIFHSSLSVFAGGEIWTMVSATFVLVATALAACWLPARKATRVEPLVALRAE